MENKNTKNLVLLHSNDLHGDFLTENLDEKLVGGVSLLSGYVRKTRGENPNTIYCIAGDMFRGSVIDSEYRGLSTVEIMNLLSPDIVTIGNHETDYGLAHLLFIEKMASFPIINANMFIKTNHKRLFKPCEVIKIDGMKILFIGILTEQVINQTKRDGLIGTLVDVEDAARTVEKIVNSYQTTDIDFTVLLTHIGFEEDKKLAELLKPELGIDVIIGGHSHTLIDKPCVVNGIPIVQAGVGTNQIGRFDIVIDTDNNKIDSFKWECIEINEVNCPEDIEMTRLIMGYKGQTDRKYNRLVTTFRRTLTHPDRYEETELGNLYADAVKELLDVDIALIGSGSVRTDSLGPIVDFGSLKENYPYSNELCLVRVNGEMLRRMMLYVFRDEMFTGRHTSFLQVSSGFHMTYNRDSHSFTRFELNDEEIADGKKYKVVMQKFSYDNFEEKFGISKDEIKKMSRMRMVSTSDFDIIEEYLSTHTNIESVLEGRITVE